MSDSAQPQLSRRRLRMELREARSLADLTQDDVAREMEWSLSKVIRIEAGSVGISINDLKALLRLYGVTDTSRTSGLLALARQSKEPSWWSKYQKILAPAYIQFIEYESAASVIQGFQTMLIPGLLQTEEYARTTIRELAATPERLDTLVEIRLQRQKSVESQRASTQSFILDEAAVRRTVGGNAAMRNQINHLITASSKRDVTIEIVPFNVGAHPGMEGPFVILQLPEPLNADVLYLEGSKGQLVIRDDPDDIVSYQEKFAKLRDLSLGPIESIAYLRKLADEMT
jgi:transcriptional regulator with XRE-family HTH domain